MPIFDPSQINTLSQYFRKRDELIDKIALAFNVATAEELSELQGDVDGEFTGVGSSVAANAEALVALQESLAASVTDLENKIAAIPGVSFGPTVGEFVSETTSPKYSLSTFTGSGAGPVEAGFSVFHGTVGSMPASPYRRVNATALLIFNVGALSYNYNGAASIRIASDAAGSGATTISNADGLYGAQPDVSQAGTYAVQAIVPAGYYFLAAARTGVGPSTTSTLRVLSMDGEDL